MASRRLFVALPLSSGVRERLAELQERLQRGLPPGTVRWVDPSGAHLTLIFLGQVDEGALPPLGEALETCARSAPPHVLRFQGLGCFPRPQRPRVLWVGVVGDTRALALLQAGLEAATVSLGFRREERAFHPHLTFGRVRRPDPALCGLLLSPPAAELGEMEVREVHLMQSWLSPRGARYTSLGRFPLGG